MGRARGEKHAVAATRREAANLGSPAPPLTVYTDASFRDGVAGLAVVGALGEHSRKVTAASNTHAEVLALRWAFAIARASGAHDVLFITDSAAALRTCQPRKTDRFQVRQTPRANNTHADALAMLARTSDATASREEAS